MTYGGSVSSVEQLTRCDAMLARLTEYVWSY
jgi:hypothetical protein